MQSDSLVPVQQMLSQGPDRLDQYLSEYEQGRGDPRFGIVMVLEVAEKMAREQISLEWACIAVRAAAIGAREQQAKRHAYLYRAMVLRTLFIAQMGSRPGHPVLDPQIVVCWFKDELKLSPQEARRNSERWKDPRFQAEFASELEHGYTFDDEDETRYPPHLAEALNELLELNLLKYRLQVLRRLAECGELPSDPCVTEWLQTSRHLP